MKIHFGLWLRMLIPGDNAQATDAAYKWKQQERRFRSHFLTHCSEFPFLPCPQPEPSCCRGPALSQKDSSSSAPGRFEREVQAPSLQAVTMELQAIKVSSARCACSMETIFRQPIGRNPLVYALNAGRQELWDVQRGESACAAAAGTCWLACPQPGVLAIPNKSTLCGMGISCNTGQICLVSLQAADCMHAETVQQQLCKDSFAGVSPSLTDCCITNQFQSSYQRTPRANPACNMSLPMISLEDSTERSGVQAVAQSLCSKYGKMLLPHHAAARGWTGVLA